MQCGRSKDTLVSFIEQKRAHVKLSSRLMFTNHASFKILSARSGEWTSSHFLIFFEQHSEMFWTDSQKQSSIDPIMLV